MSCAGEVHVFHTFRGEALGQGIEVRAGQPTLPCPLLITRATLESLVIELVNELVIQLPGAVDWRKGGRGRPNPHFPEGSEGQAISQRPLHTQPGLGLQ